MNELSCDNLIPLIKADFGALWQCQGMGNTLEIVTPFATATDKFVSVFITSKNDGFIVTDAGWLRGDQNLYGIDSEVEDGELEEILKHYSQTFKVNVFTDAAGRIFFFKKAASRKFLSSAVYDVANFLVSVVNWASIPRLGSIESEHRKNFHGKATEYIRTAVRKQLRTSDFTLKTRYRLEGIADAWFNLAVVYSSKVSLVVYVTGHSETRFSMDFKKAIVNFELTESSVYNPHIKSRVAFINEEADGFNPSRNAELYRLLTNHAGKAVSWSKREEIAEFL